ncbi:MAG: hypothetical protein ACQETQ_00870 [Spirochaetota bacterium]
MRLAIFHYHLRPGGVTGVITQASIAIGRHLGEVVDEVILVSGSEDNTDRVVDRITRDAPQLSVCAHVHHELGYVSQQNGVSLSALQRRIEDLLRGNYLGHDTVWWVHNYQLGKNPAFTAALINILETNPVQRAVLQIHDFPECARFENLDFLRSHVSSPVYPLNKNIAYATINERDREILVAAGVPQNSVYALPNPVPPKPAGRQSAIGAGPGSDGELTREAVLSRLNEAFGSRFPSFDPDGMLFLYPVRGIRRKNVLEAAFLTKLFNASAGRRANMLVTLPGASPQEKPYWDLVAAAYSDGTIPGMGGIGAELEPIGVEFGDLMRTADLVVSTSVQEGFGYAFFEAPMWGRPLLARYLDVLAGLDHLFEAAACSFYSGLRVPFESPSIDSIRAILRIRYDEQLERAAQHLPRSARERLEAEVEEMLSDHTIDFSFLMAQIQYSYTKDLADSVFANDVRSLNPEVLEPMMRLTEEGDTGGAAPDMSELGYPAYAERVGNLLSDLTAYHNATGASKRSEPPPYKDGPHAHGHRRGVGTDPVQAQLLEAFAHKDYFRLLYRSVGE